MVHLDTSFLIRALVPESLQDLQLRDWLRGGIPIGISAISWAEFLCGPLEPRLVEFAKQIVGEPVPFRAEEAILAARLFNLAGRRRGSFMDCMVAATALRSDAAFATANPADFRRLEQAGVRIIAV